MMAARAAKRVQKEAVLNPARAVVGTPSEWGSFETPLSGCDLKKGNCEHALLSRRLPCQGVSRT